MRKRVITVVLFHLPQEFPPLDVELVSIDKVASHPENPRRGNVDQIADSLREHGQYKPLIVQRSTGFIVAGNHTWFAAKRLGWTEVTVSYVDCDEVEARKILLVDNRTSDTGVYDDSALAEILASLGDDLTGTGYDPDAVDDLLAALDELPVLPPAPTDAAFGETPEQIQARRDYFADAVPKAGIGIRETILSLPQAQFEELHQLIQVIRDATTVPMNSGELVLTAMQTAARVIRNCNGSDGCAWCG
jgi:ParB-like chromosome segregation protein Spo0J